MSAVKYNWFSGQVFGKLTLTGKSFIENGFRKVEVLCECGAIKYVTISNLRGGITTSCGCYQRSSAAIRMTKHGLTTHNNGNHPIYDIYRGMNQRCYNKKTRSYKDYGARGIKICDEWRSSPLSFYNWAIENGWKEGLSIERNDNDGDYEPINCRFATDLEQSRNKRDTVFLFAFSEKKCLSEWANDSRCVVSLNGLWLRIKKGWDHEKALTTQSLNTKGTNRIGNSNIIRKTATP